MNENIRLLKPLFRGFPIIVLTVLVSVLAAKKYFNYVTPIYESTAMLKLVDVNEGVSGANLFKDAEVFTSATKISTEIEVLKSSTLIEKAISELPFEKEIYRKGDMISVELFKNSPILIDGTFNSENAFDKRHGVQVVSKNNFYYSYPESKTKIKGTFGTPLEIKNGRILVTLNEDFIKSKKDLKIIDNYEFEFLSRQKILDKIKKNLDIIPVDKDVPVIRINLKSTVSEKSALFVNKLAEVYIKDYIENKYRAANTTVAFLTNEINGANKKLSQSEQNVQNYRDKKNIINIHQETETDLRKISQLKIQQTNIKMNLDAIKELNRYIASGKNDYMSLAPNFEAFTDLLSTEMVKNMKKLQADKKELLLTYTPENDKVKVIDAKLKDLVDYQIESIKNTEKNLQIKYNNISNDIAESEYAFVGLPEKEKLLHTLHREFNLYEKNYNFLNEKRIEAEIAKSAKIAFHKVISPAEVSKSPVSPKREIITIVAAFLGLLGSIALIYLVHYAKSKVNDTFTIEKNSTIPIAFTTPFIKNSEHIKDNFLKEAIQMELKGLLQKQSIIVVSSYDRSSDHLFHSKNLIDAFIAQDRNVLAIDATGELKNLEPKNECLNYADPKFLSYTKTAFLDEINTKMQGYDLCVIHNQCIVEDRLALLFMSLATQNLIVLDSRKTAEKSILKIELLKEEYQLPNTWFVLNKAGYNPTLLHEIKKAWNNYFKK